MPENMSVEEAQKRYQKASALFREGKYQDALAELNEVARFYRNPEVLKAQEACWERLGKPSGGVSQGVVPDGENSADVTGKRFRRPVYMVPAAAVLAVVVASAYYAFVRHGRESESTPGLSARTSAVETAAAVSKPDSELAPDDFDPNAPFDLKKEVRRVMLDPRVPDITQPQWQRSSYQAVIDAARAQRLSHGNPYETGVCPSLPTEPELITVPAGPGNLTGKTNFRIRYVSDARPESKDVHWGADPINRNDANSEDIIYITGSSSYSMLTISPGTIVIVAAFQDDAASGAMTQATIDTLKRLFDSKDGFQAVWKKIRDVPSSLSTYNYYARMCQIGSENIIAKGSKDRPILVCSDSSSCATAFDWRSMGFTQGSLDYAIVLDCRHVSVTSDNSLTARSYFANHLESGRNGPGWIIACYFESAYNEAIGIGALPGQEPGRYVIFLNTFNNQNGTNLAWGAPVGSLLIENNTFVSCGSSNRADIELYTEFPHSGATIQYNNFENSVQLAISNATGNSLIASNNFWASPSPSSRVFGPVEGLNDCKSFAIEVYRNRGVDSDHDDRSDWEEVLQGTDPDDPDSR